MVKLYNFEDFYIYYNGNKKVGGYDEKCCEKGNFWFLKKS